MENATIYNTNLNKSSFVPLAQMQIWQSVFHKKRW